MFILQLIIEDHFWITIIRTIIIIITMTIIRTVISMTITTTNNIIIKLSSSFNRFGKVVVPVLSGGLVARWL
jgi:hypothetical protein